jgi:hypothetical protein
VLLRTCEFFIPSSLLVLRTCPRAVTRELNLAVPRQRRRGGNPAVIVALWLAGWEGEAAVTLRLLVVRGGVEEKTLFVLSRKGQCYSGRDRGCPALSLVYRNPSTFSSTVFAPCLQKYPAFMLATAALTRSTVFYSIFHHPV